MIQYLKLENITGNFNLPCVMDIKIGKVTWDDDADEKLKEQKRTRWPLKDITGFVIPGFMVCCPGGLPYETDGDVCRLA